MPPRETQVQPEASPAHCIQAPLLRRGRVFHGGTKAHRGQLPHQPRSHDSRLQSPGMESNPARLWLLLGAVTPGVYHSTLWRDKVRRRHDVKRF